MATKAEMAANMSPKFYFAMMFRASMNGFFMRFLKQVNGCVFVRVRVHARVCVDVCVNVCVDVRVDVCGVSSMASFGACVHGEASFVSREKRSSLPRPSIRLPHTTITNRDTYPPPPPSPHPLRALVQSVVPALRGRPRGQGRRAAGSSIRADIAAVSELLERAQPLDLDKRGLLLTSQLAPLKVRASTVHVAERGRAHAGGGGG